MKLKPRQLIGLVAIVVFGGGLIWRAMQPSEREVMEQRLASLPSISAPTDLPALPPVTLPPLTTPTVTTGHPEGDKALWELSGIDYFTLGSQAARDDLYCAGVLSAEFEAIKAGGHPDRMSILIRDSRALDDAGLAKLKAENAIDNAGAGASLAWADRAARDYDANALRLSVADCTQRAAALADVTEAGK
jgi:hypothetical protein